MRQLIKIIKVLLIIILFSNLFVWLLAHGSGHRIPIKTDLKFGITACILFVLIIFLGKNKFVKYPPTGQD